MYNKIWLVGDSLSKGVTFDAERKKYTLIDNCFFNGMQQTLACEMENLSAMGCTASKAKARLEKRLECDKPDIVVIELGGNDCDYLWDDIAAEPDKDHQPKTDVATFTRLINEMVVELRQRGIIPLLMNLPPIDADKYFSFFSHADLNIGQRILRWLGCVSRVYWWHERYNSAVEAIAQSTKTTLINIRHAFLAEPDYRPYIGPDGIHLNAAGQALIQETLTDFVRANCPELLLAPA